MRRLLERLFREEDRINEKLEIDYWRQRYFSFLAIVLAVGGLLMSSAGAVVFISNDMIIGAVINLTAYFVIAPILLNRRLGSHVRYSSLVVLLYALGIYLLMIVGERSTWGILLIMAFVSAAFLLDVDDIKMYSSFNVLIMILITVFFELGYLDRLGIGHYDVDWYVNIIGVQFFGFVLVAVIYFMLKGMEEQSEAIIRSEENLMATLNAMSDGVIVTDLLGNVIRCNPYMYSFYHLRNELGSGVHINAMFDVTEDGDMHHITDLFEHMKTYTEQKLKLTIHGEEEQFFVACKLSPILDDKAGIVGYVCLIHDMTKHREEEVHLRQTQKMEAIGTMAGGVAHDFNNMLGGILGYAELSRELIDDKDSRLFRFNQEIINTSLKASELTKQLLAYARRKEMTREAIDLNDCVRSMARLMERTFEKQVEIEVRTGPQSMMVFGDASLLENAILNLGLNGKDAMPDGGKLTVSVGRIYLDDSYCRISNFDITAGTYIHLRVKDEGAGMSKEVLSRVFEPFFTTKEIGKGTGLGLAATYGTVVSHRGAITFKSALGAGTDVDVYLPVYSPEDNVSKENPQVAPKPMVHGGHLLVIDDEDVIRTMVKEILEMLGYEVDTAADGYEGAAMYERNKDRYRGVLLDMIMPKINGREVFGMIRRINPDAKVIMISGFIDENHVDELYELGLDAFVKKPFTIDGIVEALSALD